MTTTRSCARSHGCSWPAATRFARSPRHRTFSISLPRTMPTSVVSSWTSTCLGCPASSYRPHCKHPEDCCRSCSSRAQAMRSSAVARSRMAPSRSFRSPLRMSSCFRRLKRQRRKPPRAAKKRSKSWQKSGRRDSSELIARALGGEAPLGVVLALPAKYPNPRTVGTEQLELAIRVFPATAVRQSHRVPAAIGAGVRIAAQEGLVERLHVVADTALPPEPRAFRLSAGDNIDRVEEDHRRADAPGRRLTKRSAEFEYLVIAPEPARPEPIEFDGVPVEVAGIEPRPDLKPLVELVAIVMQTLASR